MALKKSYGVVALLCFGAGLCTSLSAQQPASAASVTPTRALPPRALPDNPAANKSVATASDVASVVVAAPSKPVESASAVASTMPAAASSIKSSAPQMTLLPISVPTEKPETRVTIVKPQLSEALADSYRDERNFPRYAELKPTVAFWKRIFGQYSDTQSVIHSAAYPQKVLALLDLNDEAARMSRFEFTKLRELEEKRLKEQAVKTLRQVDELRNNPSEMSSEQRKLYDLFADISDDARFRKAADTVRSQRGLKDRTEQALETSARYLPSMEGTFKAYQLPVSLTRLPLVESSFNIEAYSKVGAAGLWQFIPSSARIYMRLNELVDDRRDPWTSTDAAARHLKDDYEKLGDWPLAITAYNYGRGGISRALTAVNGSTLVDLIDRFQSDRFGFASKNYYAEFLGALDVDREYRRRKTRQQQDEALRFDVVETKHYVPYETLRQLCGADDELFRKLNPAYRPEVIEGKLFVPPQHLIRVPAGRARSFEIAYEKLSVNEKFDAQRVFYLLHKIMRGESIGKIAHHYKVSQSAILAANGLNGKSRPIKAGEVLKIPPHVESRPGPISVAIGESVPAQTHAQRKAERSEPVHLHKVKAGQTLGSIAKQYKISLSALRDANNLNRGRIIKPGMKLKIPAASS
jgi:membrane-bound lytic murein transglycosylase D